MAPSPRPHFDWQLRTRTLRLGERVLLMQIVNLTPDSFSGDGLSQAGAASAVDFALRAVDDGADLLDMGAESTRPNATPLTASEEQERLLPVLREVLRLRPAAIVSVDTYHAETAQAALDAGAEIVNDVSGLLWDERMASVVAAARCGLVLMHTRGRPQEWAMQKRLTKDEVLPVVRDGLEAMFHVAQAAGVAAECVVLDPGFGFGKIGAENFALLDRLNELTALGRPLLVGLSRKRFLAETVGASERLHATTAAHVLAILQGAHVLRVHDLGAARDAAAVVSAI